MPVRRALVDCAVLSLQDACVFYPCCKNCFSRVDVQQRDTTRWQCSKCGFSCLKEQVGYRYRLSLRVAQDKYIFGVTAFGTCLDPFFGIHASGLQRLVEDSDEPLEAPTRSALLVKAIEDCFIGRHLIFGIKITDRGHGPLLGSALFGSTSKDTAQFIASQIILPNATVLTGCSVISYYQTLLQKASEYPLGSTDPSKAAKLPATLLLIPHQSPASIVNNTTSPASCLLSQSLQRSLHHDRTISPTPPWQQSLGLVTSSAEQEEGCSTQDSGDELSSRQIHDQRSPHHVPGCLEKSEVAEERALSPLPSFYESSSCNGGSFTDSPDSSIHKAYGNNNNPLLRSRSSSSEPGRSRTVCLGSRVKGFTDVEQSNTSSPGSVAWEDLPFSESLDVFLCEENGFDSFCETEQNVFLRNQKKTTSGNASRGHSRVGDLSNDSVSLCLSNIQPSDALSHRRTLLDISNTAAMSYDGDSDLINQTDQDPDECENVSPASNVCSSECMQEEEVGLFAPFPKCEAQEEQLGPCDGESVYDCSADLFNGSPMTSMNAKTLDTHTETGRNRRGRDEHRNTQILDIDSNTGALPPPSRPDARRLRNGEKATVNLDRCGDSGFRVLYSGTPGKQGLGSGKGSDVGRCDSSPSPNAQALKSAKKADIDAINSQLLDFIPPSQSTPIVKTVVPAGLSARTRGAYALDKPDPRPDRGGSRAFRSSVPQWGRDKTDKMSSSLCDLNSLSADPLDRCAREYVEQDPVCGTTPRRRCWKFGEPKRRLVARQRLRLQRERALNRRSAEIRVNCMQGYEGDEGVVTHTTNKLPPVKPRHRGQSDNRSVDFGYSRREQHRDGVYCKNFAESAKLNQSPTPSLTRQTGNAVCKQPVGGERAGPSKITSGDDVSLDRTIGHSSLDESEAFNCSRDLFSDSDSERF